MRSRGAAAAHFSTLLLACCGAAAPLRAQEHGYILGEEKGLQMIVHIFGEVARPGEYQVPDDTNVLQLVSKAGGPTEFSRLKDVTVTRAFAQPVVASAGTDGHEAAAGPRILVVNLDEYLKSDRSATLPVLQPGDVVRVPRNKFSAWKSVAGILRDVSVIASAYFLGVRAFKN